MGIFFKGKTVLVTGHTGFKGSWLCIWLNLLGANVIGYALEPKTPKDNFVLSGLSECMESYIYDIRDYSALSGIIYDKKPEIVFHLAAQPLVRSSYESPLYTYETNMMGTVNVLEALRHIGSVRSVVMITSDKCYENKEQVLPYKETDELGGHDPYSASKAGAELIISSYRRSFFKDKEVGVASVRAGNVIGGGDWSENRLIPDCMRALLNNKVIEVRNPNSTRPWQNVFEPISGYLLLAKELYDNPERYSQAWNFGPYPEDIVPVKDVVQKIVDCWGTGDWKDLSGDVSNEKHEAGLLSLDISKAERELGWKPVLSIDDCVRITVDWYKNDKFDYGFCEGQVREYAALCDRYQVFKEQKTRNLSL